MQKSMERARIEQDFISAAKFMTASHLSSGKLGVVGFCFGGYVRNIMAATLPDLVNAAVPFYGKPAKDPIIGDIKGPLMLHFAGLDKRVNKSWPDYETLLKKKNVDYQAFVYPDVNHGFHNDSTGRYNREAAELAWSRTLTFFGKHLS